MDVASFLISTLALFQVGDDGLRSALVKPSGNTASSAVNSSAIDTEPASASQTQPVIDQALARTAGFDAPGKSAAQLIQRLLISESNANQLRRVKLVEALASVGGVQRADAIEAYWELSHIHAQRCALERQLARLDECRQAAATELDRELANVAIRQTEAAWKAAQTEYARSAQSFAAALGGTFADITLPESLPHTGGYDTRFDEIFANQTAAAAVQQLNEQIPARRAIVDARANCVIAAWDAHQAFLAAARSGSAQFADTLAVAAHLHASELAFLESVYAYNADIADYALAVGGGQTPQTLVGMLIKDRVIPNHLGDVAERVVPASGSDGFRAAGTSSTPANRGAPTLADSSSGAAAGAPREFQPPINASPLRGASPNTSGSNNATTNSPTPQNTNTPGWEPVPGYMRPDSPDPNGTNPNPASQDSTNQNNVNQNNTGQPTPASQMRPLRERYQSNFRGPLDSAATTLTQYLAAAQTSETANSRRVTLCDCWNAVAPQNRANVAERFWQACLAAAKLNQQQQKEVTLRSLQQDFLSMTNDPRRTREMLMLHATLAEVTADRLNAELQVHTTNFELAQLTPTLVSGSQVVFPTGTAANYTQFEQQALAEADNATDRNATTIASNFAGQLSTWESAWRDSESALATSVEDFRAGGSLRTLLFALQERNATLASGLSALVEFRAAVAARISSEVPTAQQCQALTN